MIDGSLPLQAALVAAVEASEALGLLIGDRIYDKVPTNSAGLPGATFPYASLGPILALGGGGDCDIGSEYTAQIDFWSRGVGRVEAARMVAAAAQVLDAALAVDGHRMITHEVETATTQRGLDGLTTQGILRLRYQMVPTA